MIQYEEVKPEALIAEIEKQFESMGYVLPNLPLLSIVKLARERLILGDRPGFGFLCMWLALSDYNANDIQGALKLI